MKIVAFNGSPRGANSNTSVMIESLLAGLKSSESEINHVTLSDKKIAYCTGCYTCWSRTPGMCVTQDGMKGLLTLMKETDIFIFGSPLYFNNVSGTLKVFFDRLTAAGVEPVKAPVIPHIIMMSNCSHPYRSQFDIVSLWIKSISRML